LGFLTRHLAEKRAIPSFYTIGGDPWSFIDFPQKTKSGADVSENTALGVTAVWACIKILANSMASLPLITYKRLDKKGKERAFDHNLYDLLHLRPNPLQSSYEFRHLLSVHQNLWGAGLAEIEYKKGMPVALWPIPPWLVKPKINEKTKALFYEVKIKDGKKLLPSNNVLCFPSMMTSAFEWLSPISVHRESIGLSMAMTEFGARTFGQGTNPSGILKHPGRLKEQSEKDIREKFKEGYEGLSKSHRLMILEEGMDFVRIGLPPEDAQYLESRKFSNQDIARIYNVPLHLLQDHEKSTSWGTGIEEMNLGFVQFTMTPMLVQWEQEFQIKLFDENDPYFCEFLIEGMLRGKQSTRFAAYAIARQWGWMSADEIRAKENMNPLPDGQGEMYLVPMNMVDAKNAGKEPIDNENIGATEEPV